MPYTLHQRTMQLKLLLMEKNQHIKMQKIKAMAKPQEPSIQFHSLHFEKSYVNPIIKPIPNPNPNTHPNGKPNRTHLTTPY